MLPCPVCWGSAEHVGLVCEDRSGTMDPGEDAALSPTRAEHMKSHKFAFEWQHGIFERLQTRVWDTFATHTPAL